MTDPHQPRVDGDRLYGRGAYDMKAGLAAALVACQRAAGLELAGDVVVAAVADEEHASFGVRAVLERVTADVAIVTEPTELALAVAHKGFAWVELTVVGRAAHGSRPHLGLDAIAHAGPVLSAIASLDAELDGRPHHPLLGRASVHASTISGGEELSSYAARCVIGLERRTLPAESTLDLEAEIDRLLATCRRDDPLLEVSARTLLVREPLQTDPREEIVGHVGAATEAVTGAAPASVGVSYWPDAAFIAAAGIPTVVFGPTGVGAHATEEWVSLQSTETTAAVLTEAAWRICR